MLLDSTASPLLLDFWLPDSKHLTPTNLWVSPGPSHTQCCPSRPALPQLTSCSLLQSRFHPILAPNTPELPQYTVPLQQMDFGIGCEPPPFSSPSCKLQDVLCILTLSRNSHWRSQRDPPPPQLNQGWLCSLRIHAWVLHKAPSSHTKHPTLVLGHALGSGHLQELGNWSHIWPLHPNHQLLLFFAPATEEELCCR